MAFARSIRRRRLIAPRVLSEQAASRLLSKMQAVGSQDVLPARVWVTASQLPRVIAAEHGRTG